MKRLLWTLITLVLLTTALAQTTPKGTFLTKQPQTGYAPVNGLELYYEVHGSGEPIIVLHGAYMNAGLMGDLVTALAGAR